jgi:hypothetical protein
MVAESHAASRDWQLGSRSAGVSRRLACFRSMQAGCLRYYFAIAGSPTLAASDFFSRFRAFAVNLSM